MSSQLNTKTIISNVNEKYSDILNNIIRFKLSFDEVHEAELIDCDNSGIKVLFFDKKDSEKKKKGYVKFNDQVNNIGEFYTQFSVLKKEAYEGLKIKEVEVSDKIDNFRLPDGYLMVMVLCGMTFLFCFAYRIGLNPLLTELRDNMGDEFIFRTISYILYSNIIVSFLTFIVCYLHGNYTFYCTCKWMTSSFVFGMLSLAVLVPSRRLKILG
ncbi:hypothetical protein K502DRAFT_314547 [Neoconidiobolus thromboides FSU 785]|nr:hypothetical protein K502DRAFT_314547 [Neoconidiobolus thromboides FSU 785]